MLACVVQRETLRLSVTAWSLVAHKQGNLKMCLQNLLTPLKKVALGILPALAILLTTAVSLAGPSPVERDPDEVIAFLSSLRHGLVERVMDPDTKTVLQHVVDNPTIYANAITDAMQLPVDDSALSTNETYKRIGTGLGLAERIGPDHLGGAVRRLVDEATERVRRYRGTMKPGFPLKDETARKAYMNVLLLRDGAIETLGKFDDPHAAALCAEDLDIELNYHGAYGVMFRYLEKVAPLRPEIKTKLKQMYDDPASSLHNHRQHLRVIDAIDRAEADKAVSKNERKAPRKP